MCGTGDASKATYTRASLSRLLLLLLLLSEAQRTNVNGEIHHTRGDGVATVMTEREKMEVEKEEETDSYTHARALKGSPLRCKAANLWRAVGW